MQYLFHRCTPTWSYRLRLSFAFQIWYGAKKQDPVSVRHDSETLACTNYCSNWSWHLTHFSLTSKYIWVQEWGTNLVSRNTEAYVENMYVQYLWFVTQWLHMYCKRMRKLFISLVHDTTRSQAMFEMGGCDSGVGEHSPVMWHCVAQ